MADIKTPCESCIHIKVCNVKMCFEEINNFNTTHPCVKVTLECTEFYEKPHRKIENPFT